MQYPKWALDKVKIKFTNRSQETVMQNLEQKTVTPLAVILEGGTPPKINTIRDI